jgi:allene oxide cyclase
MRKTVVLASGLVISVAGIAVNAAQADRGAPAGSSASSVSNRVAPNITVVEHAESDTVVDLGAQGDSPGDLLTFANAVYDKANAMKVGRDQGSCVRTVVGKAWQCSWTTWLAGGSLVVEGPFYDSKDSVLAITGGTGAYSRARGVMHLHTRNPAGTRITFRFDVQH